MLLDAYPAAPDHEPSPIASLLSFIERRLGVTIARDARAVPFERPELAEEFALYRRLQERGIIHMLAPFPLFPDEPPIQRWSAVCRNAAKHPVSGAHAEDERQALRATLAEGLERYLWNETADYFRQPIRARVADMAKRGAFIAPERFAGFDATQRASNPDLALRDEAPYRWVQAYSLVSEGAIYLPAQTISGVPDIRRSSETAEPMIRIPITTGLATWSDQRGARLAGALEVIERDAYMITWLNQIVPSRIALRGFEASNTSLSRLLARCKRYRLAVHALRLATDAPTHAIAVVLEDKSDLAPRFAIGLKARQSLAAAIEGALIEALRGRAAYRRYEEHGGAWDETADVSSIGHIERIHYYGNPSNAAKLAFLISGPLEEERRAPWEGETSAAHLARIVAWCKERGYECASVSLGASKLNPTPWSVEMVVIPELQPTYLHEKLRQCGGERLQSIPAALGLRARETPYIDAPHPFA